MGNGHISFGMAPANMVCHIFETSNINFFFTASIKKEVLFELQPIHIKRFKPDFYQGHLKFIYEIVVNKLTSEVGKGDFKNKFCGILFKNSI